jgi:C4-dicarboxylate-specific signal transduction histidine kinase
MKPSAFDRALAAIGLCRRHTAAELQQAQMRHRAVLQALPDLMFVLTADGVYLDFYARDVEELLLKPEHFIGRAMRDVLPPQLVPGLEACFREALATGGPAVHEYMMIMHGEPAYYEARIVRCEDGTLLSVVRNMTAQKRAEQRLSAAQAELMRHWRLMGLAELASSFSRDMGQPLTAIISNAQAALGWLDGNRFDPHQLRDVLADIRTDVERAAAMIHQTRAMFAAQTSGVAPLSLNGVVREAEQIARTRLERAGAATRLELCAALPDVLGDWLQLQQVVLQLLVNAADAVTAVPAGEPRTVVIASSACGSDVHVRVADTGPGVEAAAAARIFEPLYTTKHDGIGMGLTVSRSIVEAHGGKLWLGENGPGGATFHFSIPAADLPLPWPS